MMKMEGRERELLERGMRAHVEYERQWWKNDRRGRWVVLEPGPGHLLDDAPRQIREYVDAITERRGRRFSSLSRARAFARAVGGVVQHWRRHMSRRYADRSVKTAWRYETNPWDRVARKSSRTKWVDGPARL